MCLEGGEGFCADSGEMSFGEGLFESHSVANLCGVCAFWGLIFVNKSVVQKRGECPYTTMTLLKGGSLFLNSDKG